MTHFLEQIAEYLLADNIPLYQKTIVLPNKRSGLFLKKYLAQKSQKPILAPEILSIQEFTIRLSPYQNIDWLALLFEFYQTYKKIYKDKAQTFEEFILWGPTVLKDFNEIDNFNVNAHDVFTYITAVKKIEDWQLQPENPKMITDYLLFYSSLEHLYNDLKARLKKKHAAYQGMINRYVAENIESLAANFKTKQLVFVGFNALSKTEKQIIKYLNNTQKADVFWDADLYYMKPHFEAGKFIKKHQRDFKDFKWLFNCFDKPKDIEIIGVSGKTTQTQVVANILNRHLNLNESKLEETAVILNEDDLLLPLINSLPSNIPAINITLGLALKDMPIIHFFDLLIQFYAEKERFNRFDIDIIIKLLNQKYLTQILSIEEQNENKKLLEKLSQYKTALISQELWITTLQNSNSFLNKLLIEDFSLPNLIDLFLDFISFLSLKNLEKMDGLALVHLEKILIYLKDFISSTDAFQSMHTFQYLFKRLLSQERLAFEGEPLEGLQIMGILETRLLDYKTVIITSMNEDIIPKGKTEASIIPFELKKHFGLPIHTHQNAVIAYHFYRLLQRAQKIKLIYNNATDGLGTGEPSRFITQLENELNPDIHRITKKTMALGTDIHTDELESVKKTAFAISQLEKIAEKGFSPSALTTYIRNPLSYYKKYILKLTENHTITDSIPGYTMGTIIHKVMETLYKPKIGNVLRKEDFKTFFKQYPELALKYFIAESFGKDVSINKTLITGKNLIVFEIIKRNIKDLLLLDKKLVEKGNRIEIVGLEKTIKIPLQLTDRLVYIQGSVDRIDRLNGQLRIIDYKTGGLKENEIKTPKKAEDLSVLLTDEKNTKLFQLLTYAWLYHKNTSLQTSDLPFVAGILSTRRIGKGLFKAHILEQDTIDLQILKEFEVQLRILLEEIFNSDIPFIEKDAPF